MKLFDVHGKIVRDVAFTYDDSHLISVSDDRHINIMNP